MRSNANARGRVVLPHIREEKQHQQSSSLRGHVDVPVKEVARIAGLGRKARINVPARVSRIVRIRKTNGKSPQIRAGPPSPRSDKLIERFVQDGSVSCPGERGLSIHAEPDHRLRPGFWISLVAACVPPEYRTPLIG